MKTALFTNYGNLAFIKRDYSRGEYNDYIDKVYAITPEGAELVKHIGIYEYIARPKVAETRTKVFLDDIGTECLIIEFAQAYKEIKYILMWTKLETKERRFYEFDNEGKMLKSRDMNEVLTALSIFYSIPNNFESFEDRIDEVLSNTSNFVLNRTKLHKLEDCEDLNIMGLGSF